MIDADDIEPAHALAIVKIAADLFLHGPAETPEEAAVIACDIMDATMAEILHRANLEDREATLVRGAIGKGGES